MPNSKVGGASPTSTSAWTAASRAFGFTVRNAGKSGSELGYDWPQVAILILTSKLHSFETINRRTIIFQGKKLVLEASAAVGAASTCLDVQTPAMATPDFHYCPRVD